MDNADVMQKTLSSHMLRRGTVLSGRYRIDDVIGEGGFGITYRGFDLTLELCVAVKEYFPKAFSSRDISVSDDVISYDPSDDQMLKGKESFLEEARIMAKMNDSPHIAKVRDYFEENNTAYIIMEYIDGMTLCEYVKQHGGKLKKGELFPLIKPLFPVLSKLHESGIVHKDISPENIMIDNGSVCLIDFGNARPNDGNATSNIYVRHGFSPLEQYVNSGQGARTDVYSLAAVMYFCLTGKEPPKAVERSMSDTIFPPRELGADITDGEEKALLRALNVKPNRRYQSMDEFSNELYSAGGRYTKRIIAIAACIAAVLAVCLLTGVKSSPSPVAYSVSDDKEIIFDEQKTFAKAVHVSSADALLTAIDVPGVDSIIIDKDITLERAYPLVVPCSLKIETGVSLTIVPAKDSEENGFGIYMDKDTFFINNGTLRMADDTDRYLWVVNGKDYVFINNGEMDGSFYTHDADKIYIINNGVMEMIKFTGLEHGNWWNFGTIEMNPVLEGHGIELKGNSNMYNAGTIRFYNSFMKINSSEKIINSEEGIMEFYSSDFQELGIMENNGKIICDENSMILIDGEFTDSGEVLNSGRYYDTGK